MTTPDVPADLIVVLTTKTGLSADELSDLLACTPDQQAAMVKVYKDQSWVRDPNTLGNIINILETAGAVAGAVAGIWGLAQALRAL